MDAMDIDMPSPVAPPICVLDKLPAEILLQLTDYLSQQELQDLVKASPRSQSLRKLNILTFACKTFAPWRRRWTMFSQAYSAALLEAQDAAWNANPTGASSPAIQSFTVSVVSSAQVHREGTVKKGDKEKHLESVMQTVFECYGFLPPNWAASAAEPLSPSKHSIRQLKRYTLRSEALRFPVITERMVFDVIKGLFDESQADERGYLCLKKLGCELGLLRNELETVTGAPVSLIRRIVPHHNIEAGEELMQCYMLITAYLMYTSLEPSQLRGVIVRATPVENVGKHYDDRRKVLTEYLCFLGLWMDLWEAQIGLMRFPREYRVPLSAFTPQNRRVLHGALKVALGEMFAPAKPIMREASTSSQRLAQPPSTAAPAVRKGTFAPSNRSHSLTMECSSQPTHGGRRGFQRSNSWGLDGFGSQTCAEAPETPISTLTTEQRGVVNAELNSGELMKIRAYAGTGKTRCLVEYAKLRPRKTFLYVAFNKSAEMDAKLKFGSNVTCKTVHALALSVLSHLAPHVYAAKEDETMPIPSFWGSKQLVELLKLDEEQVIRDSLQNPEAHYKPGRRKKRTTAESDRAAQPGYQPSQTQDGQKKPFPTAATVANVVKRTLERFWNSVESDVQESCLPKFMIEKLGLKSSVVLRWAKDIWRDIGRAVAPWLPHDAYLKLMYLLGVGTEGDKRAFGHYDVILFDEAQDANPCMATIILRQQARGVALIVVGDPYQRIYGFRGAENEVFDDERFPPQTTHYLTWSFRFGDGIASVANILLSALGEKVPVNGVRKIDSVSAVAKTAQLASHPEESFTVIFRKNVSLIEYAIMLGIQCPNHRMCLKIQRNFRKATLFTNLREAHALLHEGRIATTYPLKSWKTWEDLKNHIEAEHEDGGSSDSPILSLVVQLEKTLMDPTFPALLQRVEANVLDDSEMHLADIILITAHQAKGLEWDRVHVFDDFKPDYSVRNRLQKIKYWREEACVLYVALTRARKELLIQSPLREWLTGDRGWQKTYLQLKPSTCQFIESAMDSFQLEFEPLRQLSNILINTHNLIPPNSFTGVIDLSPNLNSPVRGGAVCRPGPTFNVAHREIMCLRCASLIMSNLPVHRHGSCPETEQYVRVIVQRILRLEQSEDDEEVVWCERSPWVEVWLAWGGVEMERVDFWGRGVWQQLVRDVEE